MSPRRTSRRDEFWNDQPSWDDAQDTHRTRSHRQITRSNRIIPGFSATDPTPVSQSRMFDYESDDPDYSTGTVRPAGAGTPAGGYAWEVDSVEDSGIDDDWDTSLDQSGKFGLGTYSSLAAGDPAPIDSEFDAPEIRLADTSRRVGVDPLLLRLGIIIAVAVMAVPLAISLGGGESAAEGAKTIEPADTEETSTSAVDTVPNGRATTQTKSSAKPKEPKSNRTTPAAPAVSEDAGSGSDAASSQQALSAGPAVECGQEYEVVKGDYWTRLSDAAGADLADMLAANSATLDTPLYPGSVICLSPGAIRQPAPPTTTAPPTTKAPPTTAAAAATHAPTTTKVPATTPPTTAAPTTAAPTTTPHSHPPTTTAPPTTQAPPPPTTSPPPSGSIQDIIRSVWPDDLEERALEISYRESRWDPRAENYCCVGLFQIYYDVHKSWLAGIGIDEKSDLYDPYLNSKAAYTLYQRSGGWGPWAMTSY